MDGKQIKNLRKTKFFSQTPKIQGCIFGVEGEQKMLAPRKSYAFSQMAQKTGGFLWYWKKRHSLKINECRFQCIIINQFLIKTNNNIANGS